MNCRQIFRSKNQIMPDLVRLTYNQAGKSKKTNAYDMREMHEKAFAARSAQYLLIKAPIR